MEINNSYYHRYRTLCIEILGETTTFNKHDVMTAFTNILNEFIFLQNTNEIIYNKNTKKPIIYDIL